MNKIEAIAYAQVALDTLQTSANKDTITPVELGLEMKTLFRFESRKRIIIRATKFLDEMGDENG